MHERMSAEHANYFWSDLQEMNTNFLFALQRLEDLQVLVRVFESREQQTQGEVDSPRMCFPMRPHRTARIVGNYASVEKEVLQSGAGLAGCNIVLEQ